MDSLNKSELLSLSMNMKSIYAGLSKGYVCIANGLYDEALLHVDANMAKINKCIDRLNFLLKER